MFEEWYRALHPRLVTSLGVAFGDSDLAAEAADEAVARAFERWATVSTMASPENWTFTVGFNVARRRLRRRRLERRLFERRRVAETTSGPAGELWLLVAGLPVRQRTAVVLRHVGHLAEQDVASVMGITRGAVSSTLRAAYRSLRLELTDDQMPRESS